jgi:hypothetical protein
MTDATEEAHNERRHRQRPGAGEVIAPGVFVELIYNPRSRATTFAVFERGATSVVDRYQISADSVLLPYRGTNNLIRHGVILFPEQPEEYGTTALLFGEIRSFIKSYVTLSESFVDAAAHYVLLSWIHDAYRELPYLRVRGDYGSGKTRFLQVVGSLCYKPIFASGASTVAPLFHTLDAFRGTLILDEGDFDRSDEKADIVKILNNGNAQGFPVLRMEGSREGYVNPRAFNVFGPKIIATRGDYTDPALESRFVSEDMRTNGSPGTGIPISLPDTFQTEALRLRNKLLLFRFRMWSRFPVRAELIEPDVEPRINQVFAPLLALAKGIGDADVIRSRMRELQADLRAQRGLEAEAQVLEVIVGLLESRERSSLPIAAITEEFNRLHSDTFGHPVTNKTIGFLARRKLQLKTQKSHGVFVIPDSELRKLPALCDRYGLLDRASG